MPVTENEPRVILQYRRLIAGFALLLIVVTWKLWTPQTLFPQIPFFAFTTNWPAAFDYFAMSLFVLGAIVSLFTSNHRTALIAQCVMLWGLMVAVVMDQHRLQPWTWQFFSCDKFPDFCLSEKQNPSRSIVGDQRLFFLRHFEI